MADILTFRRPKAPEKHKGKGLCREGHHKWVVDQAQVFDVKKGRLVTRFRCTRCGSTKVRGQ